MEKYSVYGELLYLGFVYEKGRCVSRGLWRFGYRRKLYKHISMLKKIITCMLNANITQDDTLMIEQFAKFITKEREMGKYYPLTKQVQECFLISKYSLISSVDDSKNYKQVNNLMLSLVNEVLKQLENVAVNKRKVAMLLRALHNLPRVYLERNAITLCNINQPGIECSDALNYSFGNMDEATKRKYKGYIV